MTWLSWLQIVIYLPALPLGGLSPNALHFQTIMVKVGEIMRNLWKSKWVPGLRSPGSPGSPGSPEPTFSRIRRVHSWLHGKLPWENDPTPWKIPGNLSRPPFTAHSLHPCCQVNELLYILNLTSSASPVQFWLSQSMTYFKHKKTYSLQKSLWQLSLISARQVQSKCAA